MFTCWVLGVMGWCINVPDNFKTVANKGHVFLYVATGGVVVICNRCKVFFKMLTCGC